MHVKDFVTIHYSKVANSSVNAGTSQALIQNILWNPWTLLSLWSEKFSTGKPTIQRLFVRDMFRHSPDKFKVGLTTQLGLLKALWCLPTLDIF